MVHLGGVRFPVTGLRYTLTADDAVELVRMLRPRTVIPIHHEGWTHFRHGRDEVARAFAGSPANDRLRWLPIGDRVELSR